MRLEVTEKGGRVERWKGLGVEGFKG